MTPTELARLAAMGNLLRPEWPTTSLATYLRRHAHRPYRDVAVALAWVAADPDTKTPARMDGPGPWWAKAEADRAPEPPRDVAAQMRQGAADRGDYGHWVPAARALIRRPIPHHAPEETT